MQGVYLVLEKLKMPAYRRLFRRVALLHADQEPAKAVQVPLGARESPVPRTIYHACSCALIYLFLHQFKCSLASSTVCSAACWGFQDKYREAEARRLLRSYMSGLLLSPPASGIVSA